MLLFVGLNTCLVCKSTQNYILSLLQILIQFSLQTFKKNGCSHTHQRTTMLSCMYPCVSMS